MSGFIPDDKFTPDEEQPFTMGNAKPGELNPSLPPQKFLGQILNKTIGDTPSEGVQQIASPIDFIPVGEIAQLAIRAAPKMLGNEIGSIGPGVAKLVEESMADKIKRAAANSAVKGPEGGLTHNAAMYQSGTLFQDEALKRAAEAAKAAASPKKYSDGGFVSDSDFVPDEEPSREPANNTGAFIPDDKFVADPVNQDEALEREVKGYYDAQEKHGTAGQQAITFLEKAAQGVVGPLAPLVETKLLGIDPEDIRARAEANPAAAMTGEITGLGGSMLTGVGVGSMAANLGTKAAAKVLPQAPTIINKIGSMAVQGAIENAAIQSSNEVTKMVLKDPNQTLGTAIADIGLMGLIGGGASGAIGSVNPLWKATVGKKTDGILGAISKKLGGIEGQADNALESSLNSHGLLDDVAPEIKAAMSADPAVQQQAQKLMDSATSSGVKYQQSLSDFHDTIGLKMGEALGKKADDIAALDNINPHEVGEGIKAAVKSKLEAQYEPIAKAYDEITKRFKDTTFLPGLKNETTSSLANLLDPGVSTQSAEAKLLKRVVKEVNQLQNLEQLRNYSSSLGRETAGIAKQELWDVGRKIRGVLNDAEERTLNFVVEHEAPELLASHKATNAAYKELKTIIGDLNDRLHAGNTGGVKTFLKNLDAMDAETILNRLNPSNKADIITELSTRFPEVAGKVKDFHLAKILKQSRHTSAQGSGISANKLYKQLFEGKMSPQMRDFIMSPESAQTIKGLKGLADKLPEKIGKSGTAQALDGIFSHLPGTATGLVTAAVTDSLGIGGIVGVLTKLVGRDVPDAARLALLKFLGSSNRIEPGAFKATVDYIQSVVKGEQRISKAAKAVFKSGKAAISERMLPDHKDTERLDKRLKELQKDSSKLLDVGGETAHYMPDHGQAMGATAANAVNYLNSLRPQSPKLSPLSKELPLNPVQKAAYTRALQIAQQPLLVLNKVQQGTIIPSDIVALNTMYPDLYNKLRSQLMSNMADSINKGEEIPYKARIGLSMFMGEPLDATMSPSSIQSAQPAPKQEQSRELAGERQKLGPSQQGAKALSKMPQSYQTPSQNREADRQKH